MGIVSPYFLKPQLRQEFMSRNLVFEPRSQISFGGADVLKVILRVLEQAPEFTAVIRTDRKDKAQALEDLEPMLDRMDGNSEVLGQHRRI